MSGLATAPYNEPTKNPLALAKRQAELVNIENIDNLTTFELIDRLRAVNASLLVDSSNELKFWSVDPLTTYRPVIEKDSTGAFITKHPAEIWESGDYRQIPWMTGVVENEGSVRSAGMLHWIWEAYFVYSPASFSHFLSAILTNKELVDDLNFRMDSLLPKLMEITPKDDNNLPTINKELSDYYLNGSRTVSEATAKGFQDLFSDRAFLYPLYKTVESYLKYADTTINPVYLYRFAYKGPVSYSGFFTGTANDFGVGHIDDLIYLFKSPILFPEFHKTSEMAKLIRMLTDTYINFAKYG